MNVPQATVGERLFRFPFLDAIRPLSEAEQNALKESIRKAGRVRTPVLVNGNDEVIDGANRVMIAAELQLPLDRLPLAVVDVEGDTAREMCVELNLCRRHLSPEELEVEREKRRKRVAELREEGRSTREIADEIGIHQATVVRDLKTTASADAPASADAVAPRVQETANRRRKGESTREIAAKTGVSEATVRRDLARAEAEGQDVQPKGGAVLGKDGKKRSATRRQTSEEPRRAEEEKEKLRQKKERKRQQRLLEKAKDLVQGLDKEGMVKLRDMLNERLDAMVAFEARAGDNAHDNT